MHDGSLPPPIPTAGGSFSCGLHSRDHQAFSADRLYHHGETARTCCERIRRGCTPIGGRVGFLMDRARNNTADVPISPRSFCRLQIRGFQKIRCLIDDVKRLQHFLIRNLLRAKSSTSPNPQFPLVVLSPIPSLSLSFSFSALPEKNNVFFSCGVYFDTRKISSADFKIYIDAAKRRYFDITAGVVSIFACPVAIPAR